MAEETVICPNCHREVPRTIYCIYCGAVLKAEPTPQKPAEKESYKEEVEAKTMEETTPQEAPRETCDADPEIHSIMAELKNYFVWRTRLLGMLSLGKVHQQVFNKLFNEYATKTDTLNQTRMEKVSAFEEQSRSAAEELNKTKLELEELKIRHAVGEINTAQLKEKTPQLEVRIVSLEDEIDHAKTQLACLGSILQGETLKEILELEDITKHCRDSLPGLVENGQLSKDIETSVSKSVDEALRIFETLLGEKRAQETKLKEELSTLETRHNVGEVSDSDYEMAKIDLRKRLEKFWDVA